MQSTPRVFHGSPVCIQQTDYKEIRMAVTNVLNTMESVVQTPAIKLPSS